MRTGSFVVRRRLAATGLSRRNEEVGFWAANFSVNLRVRILGLKTLSLLRLARAFLIEPNGIRVSGYLRVRILGLQTLLLLIPARACRTTRLDSGS